MSSLSNDAYSFILEDINMINFLINTFPVSSWNLQAWILMVEFAISAVFAFTEGLLSVGFIIANDGKESG